MYQTGGVCKQDMLLKKTYFYLQFYNIHFVMELYTNFLHQIILISDSVHKVKKGKRESNNIDDVFTLQVFLSLVTYFLNPESKNMHQPNCFQNQKQRDAILLKVVSDIYGLLCISRKKL